MYRLIPTQFHSFLSPCGQKCETLDAKWRNGKKDETEQKTTVKESGRYIKKMPTKTRERERKRKRVNGSVHVFCEFLRFLAWLCEMVRNLSSVTLGSVCFDWFLSRVVTCPLSVVSCQLCILLCFAFGFTTCCHGHGVTSWWCDRQCKESACQSVNVGLMMCFCLFHPLVYNSMLVSALFIDTV